MLFIINNIHMTLLLMFNISFDIWTWNLFLCCFIIRVFTCYSRDKKYYFALVIKVIVVFLGLIQILLVRADVCEDESFMIVYPFLIFVIGGMSLLIGEGLYTVEYDKVNEDNFDNNSKEEKLNEDN